MIKNDKKDTAESFHIFIMMQMHLVLGNKVDIVMWLLWIGPYMVTLNEWQRLANILNILSIILTDRGHLDHINQRITLNMITLSGPPAVV